MTTKSAVFNEILLGAIDEALCSLGESVKHSIYFHIENEFNLVRIEIPENLDDFQGGLEKIFGAGAQFIEILIMKNLHSKIGLPLKMESKQLEFVEYVDSSKQSYLNVTKPAVESQPPSLSLLPVFTVSVAKP